jgi:riboflavin transporter FmnP
LGTEFSVRIFFYTSYIAEQIRHIMKKERKRMSEQVLRNANVMNRSRTRTLTQIAMLGAVAGVLMNFEFPLPFLAPSFYQMDFSEIPTLIAAFAMGPVAGILTELVKILVHLVTKGTLTAGVGDFANFLFGCTFVVPAGILYRFRGKKSRKNAVLGMAAGTILTAVVACFVNAFVLLPAYGKAFGMPVSAFIEMGTAVHASVHNLLGFAVLILVPFNLFKYTVTSVIVFVIYKRIRVVLRGD